LSRLPQRMERSDVALDLASIGVVDSFSITSLYVAGRRELSSYTAGAGVFTDDRLTLEFTAPRELHNPHAAENGAALRALRRFAETDATATEWRNRAAMLARADRHELAIEDYVRALDRDPDDAISLEGLVKSALITKKVGDVLIRLKADAAGASDARRLVARSKLLAADGKHDAALAVAREAAVKSPVGLEQLASLHADSADTVQLDATVAELRKVAPGMAATEYYAAVAAFLHGDANEAAHLAEHAIGIDPNYTPSYDLVGAAYTKLGRVEAARHAFERSLSFDAHDSTAYENLGVLELNAGNRARAAKYFAEALWLVPDSQTARQGLAQSPSLKTLRP
jgi:tetratricopeptide (TPR) repeat protein